jgi:hypothetical protein
MPPLPIKPQSISNPSIGIVIGYHSGSDEEGTPGNNTPLKMSAIDETVPMGFPSRSESRHGFTARQYCLLPPEATVTLPKLEQKVQRYRSEWGLSASFLRELRQRANFRDPTVLMQLIKRCEIQQCGTMGQNALNFYFINMN